MARYLPLRAFELLEQQRPNLLNHPQPLDPILAGHKLNLAVGDSKAQGDRIGARNIVSAD